MRAQSFHITTLGCKVNQYESEALRQAWLADGACEAHSPENADIILVNSCAITARAVADVRNAVRRLHRAAPEARIILTGCAAQLEEAGAAQLSGIQRVVPQKEKDTLLSLFAPGHDNPAAFPAFPPFNIAEFTRSRPILKVQDGCSHCCTFCIVPLARGRARSRPFADCAAELERLLDAGFREIVLAGVNLRQYGPDLPEKPDFWDLLAFLDAQFAPQWQGRARLRLSSLEPGQLNEKALKTLASSRLLCPHLHLSLQSGSPDVLHRMGRGHYQVDTLVPFFQRLKEHWPVFGLGADFLVGFPGESDADFQQTYDLAAALPMSYAHVFPYSRRPGTPAAVMDNQVEKSLAAFRAARLRDLLETKKIAFAQSLVEQRLPLAIAREGSRGQGLCEFYVTCDVAGAATGKELLHVRPRAAAQGRIQADSADTQ